MVSSAGFEGEGVDFTKKYERTRQPTKVKSCTDKTILPLWRLVVFSRDVVFRLRNSTDDGAGSRGLHW